MINGSFGEGRFEVTTGPSFGSFVTPPPQVHLFLFFPSVLRSEIVTNSCKPAQGSHGNGIQLLQQPIHYVHVRGNGILQEIVSQAGLAKLAATQSSEARRM